MPRDRRGRWLVGVVVAGALGASPAVAADGRLEINQACVPVGCFPGDAPGFPVQLTQATSYVLTSDLISDAQQPQPVIQMSGGVLDLNGFTVAAVGGFEDALILLENGGVEVKNGFVNGAAGVGITGSSLNNVRLLDLRISVGLGPGVVLSGGSDVQIRDCVVTQSGGGGILASGSRVSIVGCTVTGNFGGDGIRTGPHALIADNIVSDNGFDGIEVGQASVVRGNVVSSNGEHGINLASETLVIGNTAFGNNGLGMGFSNIAPCATCTLVDNETP